MTNVARAYAAAASHRGLREQEADIFMRTNAALRRAHEGGRTLDRVRALADNDRLWTAVIDLLRDPENALPAQLKASMVSVGRTVQREMQRETPDLGFLIQVNENIAAGLSGGS
jgi:flagellar biosynthesis regulator FlaF